MARLPLTGHVLLLRLKESMRLKPVAGAGTARVAPAKDVSLAGGKYRIPANTVLWVVSHACRNSVHNWGPDALSFMPVGVRTHNRIVPRNPHSTPAPAFVPTLRTYQISPR
jgi:hypothetical protein